MSKSTLANKKKPKATETLSGVRRIAAGEFKAKCLAIMDEVNETGRPIVVTKRGKPTIKVVPIRDARERGASILGRLEGIMKINGDPDDLVKPIFPLEDWDMLK